MASIQVYNEGTGTSYFIDYTVGNAVLSQSGVGSPDFYLIASTSQRVIGTGAIVPAEIVLSLPAPNYDITEELKTRAVIIMDEVSGGSLLSTSSASSSSKSSSSISSASSISLSSLSSSSISSESSHSQP